MSKMIRTVIAYLMIALVLMTSVFAETFIFDLSDIDLQKESESISGMVEYYEGKLLDSSDLNERRYYVPQIVDFPKSISERLRKNDDYSDFNGTLRFVIKLDENLIGTYMTLAVKMPSNDVVVYINGERIYDSSKETVLQDAETTFLQHYAVFKVKDENNECIIQFKGMDRRFDNHVGLFVGNFAGLERSMNQQLVLELIYYFMAGVLLLLVIFMTVFRGGRKAAWKMLMPISTVLLMVMLKAFPIESDMMSWYMNELYPDLMFRLKNAGFILSLPIMVILLDMLDDRVVYPSILGAMWPLFWLDNAIILLASDVQLGWIALISVLVELVLMVMFMGRTKVISSTMPNMNLMLLMLADLFIQAKYLVEFLHVTIDGRIIYLLLAIQLFATVRFLIAKIHDEHVMEEDVPESIGISESVVHPTSLESKVDIVEEAQADTMAFPWEDILDASSMLLLITDHQGVVRFSTKMMNDLFVEYERIEGLQVPELLFGDHGDGARYLNKIIVKMNQTINLKELEPYISLLPDRLKITGKLYKIVCMPMRVEDGKVNLLISFNDMSDLDFANASLKHLELSRNMIKRVLPEQVIFRRVIDDFQRFVRIDLKDEENLHTQHRVGIYISRLRVFRSLFNYFRMLDSANMIQNVISDLSESGGGLDLSICFDSLDESVVSKDLEAIRQFLGQSFDDLGKYISIHREDLRILKREIGESDTSSYGASLDSNGIVERLSRKRLTALYSFIEHFAHTQAVQYSRRLKRVDVRLQDIQVGEKQYHDICLMVVIAINNALEHGGDRMENLMIAVDKVLDLSGGWIRIRVADDGDGADEGDLRSRIYSEKTRSFQDIMDMSTQEVMDHLFQPGFSLKYGNEHIVRGFGLAMVREMAEGYGGGASASNVDAGGFELTIQLPYGETYDFGKRQRDTVLKSVSQSVSNLLDYIGMKSYGSVRVELLETEERTLELKEYSAIQSMFGNREVQFTFTANADFIDIVSRVYGTLHHENKPEALHDVANEILNMIISGAMLLQTESMEDTRIGMPINLSVEGSIRIKGDEVHILQLDEGQSHMTLVVAFN